MWRKFGLTQTSNWKRGSILIAILGHCGYSSLILYQTSTSDSFLIVSLNVEPKTITLKSISLSHNSNFVTLCIGLLENTRPLKCWHFHYTVSKKKLHLFISLMTSLEKSISIVKLWASWGQMQVFQNSNFHLKAHIFTVCHQYRPVSFEVLDASFSLLRKMSAKYTSLSIVLSHKYGVPWKSS